MNVNLVRSKLAIMTKVQKSKSRKSNAKTNIQNLLAFLNKSKLPAISPPQIRSENPNQRPIVPTSGKKDCLPQFTIVKQIREKN